MQFENITVIFDDAPSKKKLEAVFSGWYRTEPPRRLENIASAFAAKRFGLTETEAARLVSSTAAKVATDLR